MLPSDPVLEHYAQFDERTRLTGAFGEFECLRTRELIGRYLPEAPASILDVGGGTGAHAFWLAGRGHHVHLIDVVPRHIDIAAAQSATTGPTLTSALVGDARNLEFADASADVVLLAGPLYHLTEREQRDRVLREVRRVLRPQGVLLSIAINRYAGVIYGLNRGLVFEPEYRDMVVRELSSGVRRDPPPQMKTFREAYFHLPNEFVEEIATAGFVAGPCLGVVGPAWQVPNLDQAWEDPDKRAILMALARELEPASLLSPQLFCAAHK